MATVVPCLHVFVEIRLEVDHLVECFRRTYVDADSVDKVSANHEATHITDASNTKDDSNDGPDSNTKAKTVVDTCVVTV